jgi:hypothetical protein
MGTVVEAAVAGASTRLAAGVPDSEMDVVAVAVLVTEAAIVPDADGWTLLLMDCNRRQQFNGYLTRAKTLNTARTTEAAAVRVAVTEADGVAEALGVIEAVAELEGLGSVVGSTLMFTSKSAAALVVVSVAETRATKIQPASPTPPIWYASTPSHCSRPVVASKVAPDGPDSSAYVIASDEEGTAAVN